MTNNTDFAPRSIAILGRQPSLGLAELESLHGGSILRPFGSRAALLELAPEEITFDRLGGSVRLAKILTPLPALSWSAIEDHLISTATEHAASAEGKLSFGISVFGDVKVSPKQLARTALKVKKAIRAEGTSVRMVPHTSLELGSATVLYNKLTKSGNWELLIVSDGKTAYLAQTTRIQDIDAYSARDQSRPLRDAKVGMLPPKLAQILINLATAGPVQEQPQTVLDPFCGTGVLLQEALIMGYQASGSDIEPRMVEYTTKNLDWIIQKLHISDAHWQVKIGDATTNQWDIPKGANHTFAVAAETFLGKPLATLPPSDQLSTIIYDANFVNHRFLVNIAPQIAPGTRLALGIPTWRGKHEFLHLPFLDHLTDMGYTRVRFEHASAQDLIYHRENQVVGRELLILEKD